ncbi:hypothetical protein ABW19_dt0203947 [Dactylella cylindrospora]|nr:hypothetical protein ABW19_dt0203947 [Dactylella cylindrospora]
MGTDVFFDEGVMEMELKWMKEWQKDAPEMGRDWTVMDKETAREKLHIPNAVGAVCGPAGALWPYRLCTSILERLIKQHESLKIETYTPVENITYNSSTSNYILITPRGTMTTPTVIHTTNGWAAQLLPGLITKLFPFQAQMSAQTPPEDLPPMGEKYSWSFIHKQGFDYLTQRPTVYKKNPDGTASIEGGEMMFGGGWAQTGNNGMDVIGVADDTKLNYLAAGYLSGLLPYVFGSGTDDGKKRAFGGANVKDMWTGVIGFSADVLPFVGKVPASVSTRGQPKPEKQENGVRTGEWISAGFSGEGMVNCWGSGTALARMVLGEDVGKNSRVKEKRVKTWKGEDDVKGWRDLDLVEWFPAEFVISKARVDRADPTDLMAWLSGSD